MEVKVGNESKTLSNSVFSRGLTTMIDIGFFYHELFDNKPSYNCSYNIRKEDFKTVMKIFQKIYKKLVDDGFKILNYSFRNLDFEEFEENDESDELIPTAFILYNDDALMVSFDSYEIKIMSYKSIEDIKKFINKYLKKYNNDDGDNSKCYIIVKEMDYYLNEFKINVDNKLNFNLYNDGFETVHENLIKSLKDDKNGLYLLHGCPGSGKTTYIRHLIKECSSRNRRFVYVPSNLVGDFTHPSFISFLINNKDCIFIVEDCENLVTNLNGIRSNVISDMLNMTDGLLADALRIKIICTFNTDEGEIDQALLRPGRCRGRYKFEKLKKDRANIAAKELGLPEVDEDVSLAELFNNGVDFKEKKKKMGFK